MRSFSLLSHRGDVASITWPCLMCFHCHLTFLTSFPHTGDLNDAPPFLRSPWPRCEWTEHAHNFFFIFYKSIRGSHACRTEDIDPNGSWINDDPLHHYWIQSILEPNVRPTWFMSQDNLYHISNQMISCKATFIHSRVQYLASHISIQVGRFGIEPEIFWLKDNHSTSLGAAV